MTLTTLSGTWPTAADPDAAARLVERFADLGAEATALASSASGRPMLDALGGGSPYLSDLLVREADTALSVWHHGPDVTLHQLRAHADTLDPSAPRATVAANLRALKR
ncbi:MAG: hypothetical protein ACRYG8_33595, partial [Janthinobacterium lividum]